MILAVVAAVIVAAGILLAVGLAALMHGAKRLQQQAAPHPDFYDITWEG